MVLEIVKSSRRPSKSGGVAPAELDEALSILVGCGVRRMRSRLSWLVCVRAVRLQTTPMGRQWMVACVAQDLLAFFFCRTCLKATRLQPTEPEMLQRGLTCLFCIDQTGLSGCTPGLGLPVAVAVAETLVQWRCMWSQDGGGG